MGFGDYLTRAAGQRERAHELAARRNFSDARRCASQIEVPWYKCQAFAWIAWYADDSEFDAFVQEAVKAAEGATDAYMTVGGLAWPVNAMIRRNRQAGASKIVTRNLPRVADIRPAPSVACALYLLWEAVYDVPSIADKVLEEMTRVFPTLNSWRGPHLLRDAAIVLARQYPDKSQRVISAIPDGPYKRTAIRRIAEGETQSARSFFYTSKLMR